MKRTSNTWKSERGIGQSNRGVKMEIVIYATLLALNVVMLIVFFCQIGSNEEKIIAISRDIKKLNEKMDKIIGRLY